MRPVDALARYLWEEGLDVSTTPWDPPGHLVVRDGDYARLFTPGEVVALAAALLALGQMDEKGRPLAKRPITDHLEVATPRGV
ncbi:hypothetical protein FJNA_24310 [Thermus sp. FJN-A]